MSKKLIAVAAAAALALTGLVAVPAGATAITNVTIYDSANPRFGVAMTAGHTDSDSAVTAATFAAARNVVWNASYTDATTRTAVRFDVNTAAAASTINITSTGGVKVIAAVASTTKVDGGSTALNGSTVAGALTYTFYAWSTSSTAGTVVIDTGSSKMTFYVKGRVGGVYNIVTPTWPTSMPQSSTTSKVTFGITDAYGNAVTSAGAEAALTGLGITGTPTVSYNSTTKLWESSTLTVSSTATNVALQLALTATDLSTGGFAKPVDMVFTTVASGSLSAQVTALTAQVAALTATVAGLTADYNSVAKKFNKLVKKSKRVALK